ncbi:hypothetical protein ACIQU6_19115 [Streptomyces sp. NPDC090442]|uniref:hypothetical protein n=1 Tax=Streptomyces sp. NPDC090442 TaxID=3365962 RepID=UPI0037F6D640
MGTGDVNGTAATLPAPVRDGFRAVAHHAFATGMRTAFLVAACVALLGTAASLALFRQPQSDTAPQSAGGQPG